MSKLNELRERRAEYARETRNLMEQNPGASWKPEHQSKYDANMAEIERISAEISREEKLGELEAERSFRDAGVRDVDRGGTKPENTMRNLHAKWLRGGDGALSAEDWHTIRNTLSTTTNSEGGYAVQSDVAGELIEALKAHGGMRAAATVFTTEQGNPMSWPTNDDTSATGELIAENTTATDSDPSFGTVALNVYKFSSKVITAPIELLQDATIDISAVVNQMLATRLARATNTYFTTGTGSSQPRGIVTAAASGKVGTTGQTTTVIYDDLVDLEHSVDPAYRAGAGFMLNDASIKVIRKIKDSEGRPIFVPGYEQGVPGGAPSTLLGRPVFINQDIATMAANAKSILFGNFKNYRIRDAMQVTLFQFRDSAYAKKGQVGFLAWMRSGGNLIDASGATVKYYQNSAT